MRRKLNKSKSGIIVNACLYQYSIKTLKLSLIFRKSTMEAFQTFPLYSRLYLKYF